VTSVISFEVEGGYTAQLRSLEIADDGTTTAMVSGRTSNGRLEQEQVEAIVAELERSRLFDTDRTYPPKGGADLQRYQIRYAGSAVVAYDTTVPPELTEVIRLLQQALRAAQG
jgi:hypothetical protein